MADITLDLAAHYTSDLINNRGGPFWTTPLIGYAIHVDNASFDLVYNKTIDGGATWAGNNVLVAGTVFQFDSWADWQTEGDAGTVIHIACFDGDSENVLYVYLDTSDDSEGTDPIAACLGTGAFIPMPDRDYHDISITKARGGNIAVAFRYADDLDAYFYGFYTSPDGDAWTSRTDPWEAYDNFLLLFPGNEADNQDVWATFWDRLAAADEISLKTFDNSLDVWSAGTLISANMTANYEYLQMDGTIRLSDGHLIFAAWNLFNSAAADLMTWDINGEGSIVAKTNVLTDSADSYLVSVFVNQANDDIYVAYTKGTSIGSLVTVFYQKSVNGGANWDGQVAMQANAEDDERWISAGAIKVAWGGKFQPVWYNDDLHDIFTNSDNGITIDGPPPPPPTIIPSTNMGSKMVAAGLI